MNITINQKKLIFITLGLALLIFIFIFGINAYYKEKKQKNDQPVIYDAVYGMMEKARLESDICSSGEFENQYKVCCVIKDGIKKGLLYDCSSQEYFEQGQGIYVIFDASRFNISYDPYFLRIYSDLNNYEEDKSIMDLYIPSALNRKNIFLMKISGTVPMKREDKSFILLNLSAYPNDTFNEKDEQVLLYREAKIFKE